MKITNANGLDSREAEPVKTRSKRIADFIAAARHASANAGVNILFWVPSLQFVAIACGLCDDHNHA